MYLWIVIVGGCFAFFTSLELQMTLQTHLHKRWLKSINTKTSRIFGCYFETAEQF